MDMITKCLESLWIVCIVIGSSVRANWDASDYWNQRYQDEPGFVPYDPGMTANVERLCICHIYNC